MELGRKIVNLRLDRGLRQEALALAAGITPSALSKIETGKQQPRGRLALRIARVLGVTVEYLIDENLPCPYVPLEPKWPKDGKGGEQVRMSVTEEERAYLMRLREAHPLAHQVAYGIVGASIEIVAIVERIVLTERGRSLTCKEFQR